MKPNSITVEDPLVAKHKSSGSKGGGWSTELSQNKHAQLATQLATLRKSSPSRWGLIRLIEPLNNLFPVP